MLGVKGLWWVFVAGCLPQASPLPFLSVNASTGALSRRDLSRTFVAGPPASVEFRPGGQIPLAEGLSQKRKKMMVKDSAL